MASSFLRLVPAVTGNLTSFDPNKPVLLLLKVANLSVDVVEDFGKRTPAFTPTVSSPRPQAGEAAGSLAETLLSAFVAGPQETTLNFNTLPACPAPSIDTTQRVFNVSFSFNFNPLFSFAALFNFETLFNILVILGLLYLFFTPPVGDDDDVYELFGPADTSTSTPRDSESDRSQATCCPCRNSLTGPVRQGRPRKTRSTSSVKQVALVSFTRSLRRTPVSRPSVPRISPQTAPLKSLNLPVQPITSIEASSQINPHATSSNTQTTEAIAPATQPNFRRIEWRCDSDVPCTESGGSAQALVSSSCTITANTASPSEVHDKSLNLATVGTGGEAGSEVGIGKGKEVSRVVCKQTSPGETTSGRDIKLAQKITTPQVRAPAAIPKSDADLQVQTPTREAIAQMKRLAPLPVSQQAFIPQPTASFPSPAVPILIDVPTIEAPPVIPMPVQLAVPMPSPAAPSSWCQQQVILGFNSHFPVQPLAPPVTIAPQLHIQPTYNHAFTAHQPGSDEHMDITDGDGDSWMRPNEFGQKATLPELIPQTLAQTIVTPAEGAPWGTRGDVPAQQPAVAVVYDQAPAAGPTPAPSANRRLVHLRGKIIPRRGVASNPLSTRSKNLSRASALQKFSSMRRKAAARSPRTERLERPIIPRVDDHAEATDPLALVHPPFPVATADLPSPQRKKRSYFDRLNANRVSPLSQRGPSEVSLMGCKAVPKSASLRKAFIWQRHFAARDRRAAGTDGRINIIYQNDPTTGYQVVTGSQRKPAQPKASSGDHFSCPRRKRPTAADFIRAEDAEKEEEILDSAVDALQSMGLNSENSVLVTSGSESASDALGTGPTPSLSSVTQDLEFHQDQAQLLLEDIFENFEEEQDRLATSVPSDFSSDTDSGLEDD